MLTKLDILRRLRRVFVLLYEEAGDTDPSIENNESDEDIQVDRPVFWCCREVEILINDLEDES